MIVSLPTHFPKIDIGSYGDLMSLNFKLVKGNTSPLVALLSVRPPHCTVKDCLLAKLADLLSQAASSTASSASRRQISPDMSFGRRRSRIWASDPDSFVFMTMRL